MKSVYLSHFIDPATPLYGGKTGNIRIEKIRSLENGDSCDSLHLAFPGHTGTHIDLPRHFCADGKALDDYPPETWHFSSVGFVECEMAELPSRLDTLNSDISLLLVRTGFERFRGQETYWARQPAIEPSLADLLKTRFPSLRALGFDMISLSSFQHREKGQEAHRNFLCKHGILLIEDMHLEPLKSAPSTVWAFPLQIRHADGVPCTVVANV